MSSTQAIALERALAMLNASGAEYIVRMPDGAEYQRGELRLAEPKPVREKDPNKPKKGSKYGWGTLTNYITPLLSAMNPGDVVVVPFDRFEPIDLGRAVTSTASRLWGNSSYISSRTAAGIEVLRVS